MIFFLADQGFFLEVMQCNASECVLILILEFIWSQKTINILFIACHIYSCYMHITTSNTFPCLMLPRHLIVFINLIFNWIFNLSKECYIIISYWVWIPLSLSLLMILVNDLILFHNLNAFYDIKSMIDYLIGTN